MHILRSLQSLKYENQKHKNVWTQSETWECEFFIVIAECSGDEHVDYSNRTVYLKIIWRFAQCVLEKIAKHAFD